MGNSKNKDKTIKKTKPKCCGKFRKKGKHCSRCPVIFREQCKLETERSERRKKKTEKKADKALSKKKVDKKRDKNKSKKKDKKKKKK